MATLSVDLRLEHSPEVERFWELLERLFLAEPPEGLREVVQRFLSLGDSAFELRRVDARDRAAGARELLFSLEFSERGLVLASACFAGDFDAV